MDEIYKQYKGKRCIVTGGKGFIGSALTNKLLNIGAFAYTYDLKSGQDIRDFKRLQSYIYETDYVFHLAALTEVADSYTRPFDYYSTNVTGTLNVLEACAKIKPLALVVASTDKVYGDNKGIPYDEYLTVPSPTNDPYSYSKWVADEICQNVSKNNSFPIQILRSVNTYGPYQKNKTTLIVNTIERIINGQCAVAHKGMIDIEREWLYIDDAVSAYLLAGIMNKSSIMNIGSGEVKTVNQVISAIQKILNVQRLIEIIDDGMNRVGNQSCNNQFFLSEIHKIVPNWKPMKFEDGLKRTIEWYLQCQQCQQSQ